MGKITRNEWRDHHGLTEEEMQQLEIILKMFNGTISAIHEKKK